MSFLTEDLISAAKLSEFFPTGQGTFTDPDDFITFANQEMWMKLVPWFARTKQDFFKKRKYTTLQAGLNHYAIPERALMNSFKDLWYVPDTTQPWRKSPIPKIQEHDEDTYDTQSGSPAVFDLEDNEVIIIPTPGSGAGSILFTYYERPNAIVATSSCAKITAVSSVGGTTTLNVNTDLTASLSTGSLIDLLCAKSPYRLWAKDVALASISSTQMTMTTTSVSDGATSPNVLPAVGDYVCPAQTTCIPLIPLETHVILAEMICARVLKALGLTPKMQACNANISDMLKNLLATIENRVDAEVDTIYDRNGLMSAIGGSFYPTSTR
jgi:hypothetical protein